MNCTNSHEWGRLEVLAYCHRHVGSYKPRSLALYTATRRRGGNVSHTGWLH